MLKATFYGGIEELRGRTALIKDRPNGKCVAQFDDFDIAPWCYGWHEFDRHEFVVAEAEDKSSWCGNDSSPFRGLYDENGF